jgi:hypothetical protein
LFGAVCPSTGETEALIVPHVDKCIMTQHLEQISAKTVPGRYAVVIMDGADWHQASLVEGLKMLMLSSCRRIQMSSTQSNKPAVGFAGII